MCKRKEIHGTTDYRTISFATSKINMYTYFAKTARFHVFEQVALKNSVLEWITLTECFY